MILRYDSRSDGLQIFFSVDRQLQFNAIALRAAELTGARFDRQISVATTNEVNSFKL